jgi:hypothetical protein
MGLRSNYRILHSEVIEYTFLSIAYRPFSKIENSLRHKAIPHKCKKIEMTSYILSDNSEKKIEIKLKISF